MTIFHTDYLEITFWDFLSKIWKFFCSTHESPVPAGLTAAEDSQHHALSPGSILDKKPEFSN